MEQATGVSAPGLAASASAPAAVPNVIAHSPEEDNYMLTQTQPCCVFPVAHDQGVHARLISLSEQGVRYEVKKDQKEVRIGRHPDCEIKEKDKRVSATHLRIYRDDFFRYFVE